MLQGLHKHTPHSAACFLTILRCSHTEQTERCLKEHFCLECGLQEQVQFHETSKKKISTHKVLRGGEINFLQGTWCSAGTFANIKGEGYAFLSGDNSRLSAKNKRRGKPQIYFHSHLEERLNCATPTFVSSPMAGKGLLTLVTGALALMKCWYVSTSCVCGLWHISLTPHHTGFTFSKLKLQTNNQNQKTPIHFKTYIEAPKMGPRFNHLRHLKRSLINKLIKEKEVAA